jgi:hypothetical protein
MVGYNGYPNVSEDPDDADRGRVEETEGGSGHGALQIEDIVDVTSSGTDFRELSCGLGLPAPSDRGGTWRDEDGGGTGRGGRMYAGSTRVGVGDDPKYVVDLIRAPSSREAML